MVTSGLVVWKAFFHAATADSWALEPPAFRAPVNFESAVLLPPSSLAAPHAVRPRARVSAATAIAGVRTVLRFIECFPLGDGRRNAGFHLRTLGRSDKPIRVVGLTQRERWTNARGNRAEQARSAALMTC